MAAGPPPGIYQDPTDPSRQRYWDGTSWGQQLPETGAPIVPPSTDGALLGLPPQGPGPSDDPWLPASAVRYASGVTSGWQPAETRNLPGAVRACFAKYATFSGRASRSEFWYFYLFASVTPLLAVVAVTIVDSLLGGLFVTEASFDQFLGLVEVLFTLTTFVPGFAVSWRRMHDINRSGLYSLIPIYGWFILPAFKGTPGPNRYG